MWSQAYNRGGELQLLNLRGWEPWRIETTEDVERGFLELAEGREPMRPTPCVPDM
jgi:hypothetical protein